MGFEHGRSAALPMRVRPRAGSLKLGEQLVAEGLITVEQLDQALAHQRRSGLRIGEALFQLGYISSPDLSRVLAQRRGLPFVDLAEVAIDPEVVRILPVSMVHRLLAVPYATEGETVVLAMINPEDGDALAAVRAFLARPVRVVMCDPEGALTVLGMLWPEYCEPVERARPADAATLARHLRLRDHAARRLEAARELAGLVPSEDGEPSTASDADAAAWRDVVALHSAHAAAFLAGRPGDDPGAVAAARFVPGWPGADPLVCAALSRLAAQGARARDALDAGLPIDGAQLDDLGRDLDRVLTCFAAAIAPEQRSWFGEPLLALLP